MKKMPFFSIIIPAYNAQDYIENCIKSILEQNFQNYEIIIIDDGSTDDTLKIIASYAQACDNIIFSHKENGEKAHKCEGLVRMFLRFRFCGIVCYVLYRFSFPQSDL